MSANRVVSRPFSGPSDLDLLLGFARTATAARWPSPTYLHVGDVIWRAFGTGGSDPSANARLWFDGDNLAGYAWVEPPAEFRFDVHPGFASAGDLLPEMLRWAEDRCALGSVRGEPLSISTWALDSEEPHIDLLDQQGYERTELHGVLMRRSLDAPVPESSLPAGARVRHATDDDIEQRVAVHRDAWSVWGPSPFSADVYHRVRAAPVYSPELDLVVEMADGAFASCCICWEDTANGIGSFEPVGTRPAFAGQGLARAMIYEGLRRLKQRGMHTAIVGTASINERALRLYPSCGFHIVGREHAFVKRLDT